MTTNEAKRAVKSELDAMGVTYTKLTAKTWDFTDLAGGSSARVTIHGIDEDIFDPTNAVGDELRAYLNRKGKGYLVTVA